MEKEFRILQNLPYEKKVEYAKTVANEFYEKITVEFGAKVHVSVGGLDSITLLVFLRHFIDKNIPAVSVSSAENASNRKVHKMLGITELKPVKSKAQVIQEFGFPVISKMKARKIEILQNPDSEKQTFIHAVMTGDMGAQGKFQHSDKIKLPDKWLKLFGGHYQEHRQDLCCQCADFKVSDRCCYWIKEKPCDDWAKENNSYPYLGLMASEGGQRELGLVKNGSNYFGKDTIRSAPFAIFYRDDVLRLALDLSVPIPEVYGDIIKVNGKYETTGAKRTGCEMCGFGIHIEPRPHRFDRLREQNPKAWEYWMYKCVTDESGTYGWGRVLDYIGVKWESPAPPKMIQQSFWDLNYNDISDNGNLKCPKCGGTITDFDNGEHDFTVKDIIGLNNRMCGIEKDPLCCGCLVEKCSQLYDKEPDQTIEYLYQYVEIFKAQGCTLFTEE